MKSHVDNSLPPGWSMAKLGEVLPLSYGKSLVEEKRDSQGSVPVFGSSGQVGRHSTALVDKPTLIIGRKGNVGAVYQSDDPCWVIDTAYFASNTSSLNLRFFRYIIDFLELGRLDRSTAVPGLSRSDYNEVVVPIPPENEQKRIVAELEKQFTRLDTAVTALKHIEANLKRYRAAVLKTACEGRLVPTEAELARGEGRPYEPASVFLEGILADRGFRLHGAQGSGSGGGRESSGGANRKSRPEGSTEPGPAHLPPLPEGWVWTSLGQLFMVCVGATPSRAKTEFWNGDIPWVSSGEVGFCRIRETRESITSLGLAHTSTLMHPPGTVLLGMIGEGKTRGQVAILEIEACNNQNSAAIRVQDTPIPPEYVYRFLEGEYDRTRRRSSGGNQPALNKERVKAIPFPLPPLAEIQRIVKEVERCCSLIDQLEKQVALNIEKAARLRQAVLGRAFDGQLVEQDPNDESSSILLERIRNTLAESKVKTAKSPRRVRPGTTGEGPHQVLGPASTVNKR
jgi:type I restriction enzyme S subunit